MSPLDKIRKDLADHVYAVLDANFPRYRALNLPGLAWEIERAALIGVVRWSVKCSDGNKVKAAKRSGINRNTLRRILDDSEYMYEVDKYEAAEASYVALEKQGFAGMVRGIPPTNRD